MIYEMPLSEWSTHVNQNIAKMQYPILYILHYLNFTISITVSGELRLQSARSRIKGQGQ
jgi:hypothetical protein